MKGYRRISTDVVELDELATMEDGDLENSDEQMRGILSGMAEHFDKTGCRDYRVVVYARTTTAGKGGV